MNNPYIKREQKFSEQLFNPELSKYAKISNTKFVLSKMGNRQAKPHKLKTLQFHNQMLLKRFFFMFYMFYKLINLFKNPFLVISTVITPLLYVCTV